MMLDYLRSLVYEWIFINVQLFLYLAWFLKTTIPNILATADVIDPNSINAIWIPYISAIRPIINPPSAPVPQAIWWMLITLPLNSSLTILWIRVLFIAANAELKPATKININIGSMDINTINQVKKIMEE